jgi:MoxR-like ATPase
MRELDLGASPRASKALLRAARVRAAMAGRDFVTPDDVDVLAGPVLTHRLLLTRTAELDGVRPSDLVTRAVASARVPYGVPVG